MYSSQLCFCANLSSFPHKNAVRRRVGGSDFCALTGADTPPPTGWSDGAPRAVTAPSIGSLQCIFNGCRHTPQDRTYWTGHPVSQTDPRAIQLQHGTPLDGTVWILLGFSQQMLARLVETLLPKKMKLQQLIQFLFLFCLPFSVTAEQKVAVLCAAWLI